MFKCFASKQQLHALIAELRLPPVHQRLNNYISSPFFPRNGRCWRGGLQYLASSPLRARRIHEIDRNPISVLGRAGGNIDERSLVDR